MTDPTGRFEVVDNPEARRYEARIDGQLAGVAEYRDLGGTRVFFHTEVAPEYEGKGVGGRLAAGALDDARARAMRIRVKCPFIAAYLERHPEYGDLVSARPARR